MEGIRPLSFDGRQSPFRRQNSVSPGPTTPTKSPTKVTPGFTSRAGSLSPEKQSPFVRRPSQIGSSDRAASPFARPSSSLSISSTPIRPALQDDQQEPGESRVPANTIQVPRASTNSSRGVTPEAPTLQFDGPSTESTPPVPHTSYITIPNAETRRPSTNMPFSPSLSKPSQARPAQSIGANAGFKHVPPPLLRSMRESFEVLDSSNSGSINSASVSAMLEQMGQASSMATLQGFYPPNAPSQLNLARYLDILSGPLADMSHNDELSAAFEAFDVDDSGQIDIAELRHALLNTAPEPGEQMVRLSERDVDGILGEFASRRAFGAKGLNVAKTKGEVFRYRDFMATISGGGMDVGQAEGVSA